MGHIKRSDLNKPLVVVPNKNIIDAGSEFIGVLIEKIINNSLQITSLENIRDTLLPKLLNGKIEVIS